ncbi:MULTISPECIES: hypothetical protein [Gordonia]|uniref:Uncharacterized protein n=1 Tax=Gordonia sputi NBRC 100414 TaxID=1089453 RepID=H5U4D6_9ACTN|nr:MULTISPECIES: hypothetical protein [Gordonia]NKY94329.1 hypothetical protein [Gordonia sputi]OBA65098.1 hypothetical protein A5777_21230 [Gordonia sp. 852002-10350_SCH5691597]GAB40594.1 hypothetical protein GOSPT_111_00090 [Gordonia sputi NBRC 100414]
MTIRRFDDASVADWLMSDPRDWGCVVTRGPLGFDAYARLLHIPDPAFPGQCENDVESVLGPSELWQIAVAVEDLRPHTTTPDEIYYLIWDGCGYPELLSGGVPIVEIHDERGATVRDYHLFVGDTDMLGWLPPEPEPTSRHGHPILPPPAFIWPADRAWCFTEDIDPHFATIGASAAAIADLLRDTRIDTVADDPDVSPPFYC